MNIRVFSYAVIQSQAFKRLSMPMQAAVRTVFKAAVVVEYNPPKRKKTASKEGHRSTVTVADVKAQRKIFSRLLAEFPTAKIMGEEKIRSAALISWKNPSALFEKGLRFIVDPIDGTTLFAHMLSNWTIGIGVVVDGVIMGSVIFAQTMNGGLIVFAEKGKGAFYKEGDSHVKRISRTRAVFQPKQSVVMFGVDFPFCPNIAAMEKQVALNVQGFYTAGSSLLALALVALGRVALVVQPPQKPWDWAQAFTLLNEAGKTAIFYRAERGTVRVVKKPDRRAFLAPREKNGLGFFWGEKPLVKKAWQIFPKKNWEMSAPDTVAGRW